MIARYDIGISLAENFQLIFGCFQSGLYLKRVCAALHGHRDLSCPLPLISPARLVPGDHGLSTQRIMRVDTPRFPRNATRLQTMITVSVFTKIIHDFSDGPACVLVFECLSAGTGRTQALILPARR